MASNLNALLQDTLGVSMPSIPYAPKATYQKNMDFVEFMKVDDVSVSQRVDGLLTLCWNADRTEVIGFRLKGFHWVFNTYLKSEFKDTNFLDLAEALEVLINSIGLDVIKDINKREAYKKAQALAAANKAAFELPLLAA